MSSRGIRICHITTVHPRYDTRIFVKECASLAKTGFEVFLIVADGLGDEVKNGVQILDIGKPSSRKNRILFHAKTIRKKAASLKAGLYHFHDPELLRVGARLSREGYKVIYDSHEDVPRQMLTKAYLPKFLWRLVSVVFERYENRVVRKLSGVVTATPFIRDRFLRIHSRVVAVQNFPFLKEFETSGKPQAGSREKAVCYVGSITRVRGIEGMVRSLNHVSGVKLLLGGTFESEALRKEIRNLPGWEHVEELGFVNREEISNTLKRCMAGLVVLHPTINYLDSIPVKMFEYMAVGLPVIASEFPYWKELLQGVDCAVFVDPLSPEDIAKAIAEIIADPEKSAAMGARGKMAVREQFNWGNEESKLISLYTEILG